MEHKIIQNIPTAQSAAQTSISTPQPIHQLRIFLYSLLALIAISVSVFIYMRVNIRNLSSRQSTASPTQAVINSTPTPSSIQTKTLPDSVFIKGWKHYSDEKLSIELPHNWNIFDFSHQRLNYEHTQSVKLLLTDSATDPRYDPTTRNGSSNTVEVSLGTMYSDKKWTDLTTSNTFFELRSKLWTDRMQQSGGGARLQTKIQIDQLANLKVVKRTNIWTQATEGVDSIDTNYFFPDFKSADQLLVWNIHYRLPIINNYERKKLIDQILSTMRFTGDDQDSSIDPATNWTTYKDLKNTFLFKYPASLQLKIVNDASFILVGVDGTDRIYHEFRVNNYTIPTGITPYQFIYQNGVGDNYGKSYLDSFAANQTPLTFKDISKNSAYKIWEPSTWPSINGINIRFIQNKNQLIWFSLEPYNPGGTAIPFEQKYMQLFDQILSTFKFAY